MSSDAIRKFFVTAFVIAFFLFLFGPLIVMSLTAFNSASFPRITPWECFSVEWFDTLLNDKRIMSGVKNSILIGFGVVVVAVPLGLAGALLLTQVSERARPWYYTILISPILIPGVVLGISTLIFWDRMGQLLFGESVFYNGYFLTILGQSTFISAYTMLVFIARLQRFDPALEEAALDLGATHVQTFRRVMLPFLKPAIASASVLAFLASFENYNTTVFTIVSENTLTTELASKVRYGINPSISALAVTIVVFTLLAASLYELSKRRELRREMLAAMEKPESVDENEPVLRRARRSWFAEPALYMILLIFLAGLLTAGYAGTQGVDQCKVEVRERKQEQTRLKIEAMQERRRAKAEASADQRAESESVSPRTKESVKGTENFNNVFDPGNLKNEEDVGGGQGESKPRAPVKGTENFNSIFDPGNLKDQQGAEEQATNGAAGGNQEAPAKGTENFNNVFDPNNLKNN